MKVIVNPDKLVCDDSWQVFHKVRAIIENEKGEYIISSEGGKYIFPGGKLENGETNLEAIKREIREETGLDFNIEDFEEVLELETLYKDFYDFRTNSLRPRFTSTVYYYVKCSKEIDLSKLNLTSGEISEGFKVAFVNRERLIELLSEDHSNARNGSFFDEENRIVVENILNRLLNNIYNRDGHIVHNINASMSVSSIKEEEREKYLTLFSEGSNRLRDCLDVMWKMNLFTIGCCFGSSEEFKEGFIATEDGVNLFEYLSPKVLDDDMVRLHIYKKGKSKCVQRISFAGSQERKEEILLHLVEDLLTGIKDNAKEVNNKIGKPFATSYLIDKKEYELRKLGLPEEIIAEDLLDYRKLLLENDQKDSELNL